MNISRPAENRRIKIEYQHVAPCEDSRAASGWEEDYYQHWRSKGRNLGILINGISEFFNGISETTRKEATQ